MALTVLGVRHGEVHNPGGVIYAGLAGYGLSDAGRAMASGVAEALRGARVVALYSSPLDRAMQTAAALSEALGLPVRPDERLYEWKHWHQWAGMTWDELRTKGREAWDAYRNDPGSVTSGESLAELGDRMESWLSDVRRSHDDGIVVGVSHLEPLRAIVLRLLGRPVGDLFEVTIGLGHAVRLEPEPDAAELRPEQVRAVVTGAGADFG
jgi:broad specificity phosphatase PhoE